MTPRLPRWERRLHTLIVKKRDLPHDFGTHDCLIWCGLAVKAVTGEDFVSEHVGKYDSHAKAYRHLKEMGFDSPAALLDSLFDEKPIGFVGRGDLVLVKTESSDNPGVCFGHYALLVGEQGTAQGLVRAPRQLWLKAWAVGEHHSGPFNV